MLEQVLDLLTSQDSANIKIVWQILQGNEDLKNEFEEWFRTQVRRITMIFVSLPKNESDFIKIFQMAKIKYDYRFNYDARLCYLIRTTTSIYEYTGKYIDPDL